MILNTSHDYRILTPDLRLQDSTMDGSTLTFETLEHGGKFPGMMPQAIRVTDPEGRHCTYIPIRENGEVVQSLGFSTSRISG